MIPRQLCVLLLTLFMDGAYSFNAHQSICDNGRLVRSWGGNHGLGRKTTILRVSQMQSIANTKAAASSPLPSLKSLYTMVVPQFVAQKTKSLFDKKKTFEYFTVATDWSLFFIAATMANSLAKNAITAVLTSWILYSLLFAREYIYVKGMSNNYIPKAKQIIHKNWYRFATSTVGMISVHTFLSAQTSWISLGPVTFRTLLMSWIHYVGGALVWDICAFQFIHRLLHKQEFFFIHKPHHIGKRDCNAFSAQSFDIRDLIPSFAFSTCSMLLFGKGNVHLMTLLMTMIAANNNHSCNPFSVIMFNPILDKLFRVNMSHQCHYARPKDEEHMGNLPIHHLVPSLRKKDIEKFDKIFNTKISA